jgi:putative hydrolase of the HAD superfamily
MTTKEKKFDAVVFDYGEVISQPMNKDAVHVMSDILQVSPKALQQSYWKFRDDYDLGRLTGKDYWQKVSADLGRNPSDEELARLLSTDIDTWKNIRPEMIEFARELKESGVKIAILSNMHRDFLDYLNKECEWMQLFDVRVFSCELGIMKPEMEIYQFLIQKLQTEPSKILFIDDRQVNVDGAIKAGLKSVVFSGLADLPALEQSLKS